MGGGFLPTTPQCYTYDHELDQWNETFAMVEGRRYARVVLLSETTMWITGGHGDNSWLASTEICTVRQGCYKSVDLPAVSQYHNVINIDGTHVMYYNLGKAWMFDITTQDWTPLADGMEERIEAYAGLVEYPDGRREVIIAGGYNTKTSEIFDLDTEEWTAGQDLSVDTDLYGGISVQYGSTFIIAGGFTSEFSYESAVQMFDLEKSKAG